MANTTLANFTSMNVLSPARLFVEADAERDLADDLVAQRRVGRMETAGAAIAEQPLQLALLEHPEAAREIERAIDDAERRFRRPVLEGDDAQEPVRPDAPFGPIVRHRLDVRP